MNKYINKTLFIILSSFLLLHTGNLAMAIEEPEFTVTQKTEDMEIREYAPYIVAETFIQDAKSRNAASNEGFRRLFRYISGNNTASEKITMTAPVLQSGEDMSSQKDSRDKGEKITMTAPVEQNKTEDGWRVAFVLPASYTMDTAPVPDNDQITLRQIEPRLMAVKSFSGRWNEKNVEKHKDNLMNKLKQEDYKITGEPVFAAYNAPFSLPFMRRNEVMVEISKEP